MRQAINLIGGIFFLVLIPCLIWGTIAGSVRETFNTRRQVIKKQCENSLPILLKRYQSFAPLLELCEQQDDWSNSFAPYVNEQLPAIYAQEQSRSTDDAEERHRDLTRFTIEKFGNYSSGYPIIVVEYSAMHDGITRFTNGATAFNKVAGAIEIEANIRQIVSAATNFDAINTNVLLSQLETDLAATEPEATAAISTVSQSVAQYNSAVASSRLARFLQIEPLNIDSQFITWEEGHRPD